MELYSTTINHICIVPKEREESWNHYGLSRGAVKDWNDF